MLSERTRRDHARRDRLLGQARQLEAAIDRAMQDYPGLWSWKLPLRDRYRWDRAADGWRAYRSAGQHARALRRYLDRAVHVAASRISEAYGLGQGAEWMARHGLDSNHDSDARAAAQTRASVAAVLHR
jgi:hypothetical protein